MHDDDSTDWTAGALGALAREPVPAARTTVEEVVARGKRRLRLQRVAAVGGAVAVVAALTGVTLVLRPGGAGTVPVATQPPPITTTSSDLDGYTTVPAFPPSVVGPPPTSATSTTITQSPPASAPTSFEVPAKSAEVVCGGRPEFKAIGDVVLQSRHSVEKTLLDGINRTSPDAAVAVAHEEWDQKGIPPQGPYGFLSAAYDGGRLDLQAMTHSVSPTEAADEALAVPGCAPARRKTLVDGTVLQLYPRAFGQQTLRIFLPSGRAYALTVRADTTWPTTEAGLATIGDELAALG